MTIRTWSALSALVVAGACTLSPDSPYRGPAEEGEGEGSVVAEGEGEGEGEGSVVAEGEGEGSVVAEGEGEGHVVAEGEGEGSVVAEGEGEGLDVSGRLNATLCDPETGAAVRNATVRITSTASHALLASTTTDSSGAFALPGLLPGFVDVAVRGTGYARTFRVLIESGVTTLVQEGECRLHSARRGAIVGHVCNGGADSAGATIVATRGAEHITATTDTDGMFYIEGLEPGTWNVGITGNLPITLAPAAVVKANTRTIVDGPGCSGVANAGAIVGRMCAPVGNGRYVGALALRASGSTTVTATATTDADGFFRFDAVPPGTWELVENIDFGSGRRWHDIVVEPNQTRTLDEERCVPVGTACHTFAPVNAPADPPDLLFVLDASVTMNSGSPGMTGSKWTALGNALDPVLRFTHTQHELGLLAAPTTSGQCAAGTLDAGFSFARDSVDAFITHVRAITPAGETPTAQTLEAALTLATQRPSRGGQFHVVIATDGGTDCNAALQAPCACVDVSIGDATCPPELCLDDAHTVDQIGRLRDLDVPVHVIGVGGLGPRNVAMLTDFARVAGRSAYDAAVTNQDLNDAIAEVVAGALMCRVTSTDDLTTARAITVRDERGVLPRDPTRTLGWDIVDAHTVELYGEPCDHAFAALLTDTTVTPALDVCP